MDRAGRALRHAEMWREEFPPDALSRAYYAMFYAAPAALLSEGVRRRKHRGVIAAFGERISKPGLVDREHHRALTVAFKDREVADYQVMAEFGSEQVGERIAQARVFMQAVKGFLANRGLSPEGG